MPTENGWEPSPRVEPDSLLLVWRTVPGTEVTMQVRNDDAGTVMLAYAADYHAYVEPLRDADSACYTPTNSVATSNHLNATAMDLNWNSHPFLVRNTFTVDQLLALRDLLAFYSPWMFWAGDWNSPIDEMHHQMGYGTFAMSQNGLLSEWISKNIRSDGFSIYNRQKDDPKSPQTTEEDQQTKNKEQSIKTLYDAVPLISIDFAKEIIEEVMRGLLYSECNNPKRIAMWLAQIGWESDGFKATEEYAKNNSYAPYIGRTWIQITWQSNYADFGKWCVTKGLIEDPNFFIDNPSALADKKWAAIGPGWYWTVARPQINKLCDAGDLIGVTKAINGGTNGLNAPNGRKVRYEQALSLGDRLLDLIAKTELQTTESSPNKTPEQPAQITQGEWDSLVIDVREIRRQLNGDGIWPQTGNDSVAIQKLEDLKASGKPMSTLDMIRWIMLHVVTHKDPRP